MKKQKIFISHSHKAWKEYLHPHPGTLEKAGQNIILDDREIDPGGKWFDKIKQVMYNAAVYIISYLPSTKIAKHRNIFSLNFPLVIKSDYD